MKFIKVGMLNFTDNMTDNMSEKEFSDLKKQIIKLSEKYFVCVITKSKKKNGDKYYSLTVKCPFCKKQTKYDYCRIINQFHYGFDAVCRHCYKHYYVASLPQYIVLKKIRFIIPHYIKTVRFLKTLMIKKKIK